MRPIFVAVVAALAGLLPVAPDAFAADATLEAVILVNRHGVRSPIEPASELAAMAADPWPDFGVPEGYLTPRGRRLANLMGGYYGAYFRNAGLLPATGCPARGQIYFRADDMQRTIETARAMSKGMLPGCNYPIARVTGGADPLIDPQGAGICPMDDKTANLAQNAMVGGSWQPPVEAYGPSLSVLQDTLKCCGASLCAAYGLKAGCTLLDLPAGARSAGPIGIGAVTSEILLMEYATGMPLSQVAWGRAGPGVISFVNMSHALAFWAYNANPYVAGRAGSNLANDVLARLRAASAGTGPRLSVIVAHDDNILNLAGLLGVGWFLESYQQNQVPPAAGIAFELWRDTATSEFFVKVVYRAQTMRQLRKATTLTLAIPPAAADLTPGSCGAGIARAQCPYTRFHQTLLAALIPQCVATQGHGLR